MTLATPAEILENQPAVLAVNVVTLEHAEAFVRASEATGLSLVLQLSENAVKYHGSLAPLGKAMLAIAAGAHALIRNQGRIQQAVKLLPKW